MSAEVETMMFTGRERSWHGLGTMVEEAQGSREALVADGLDWDDWHWIPPDGAGLLTIPGTFQQAVSWV